MPRIPNTPEALGDMNRGSTITGWRFANKPPSRWFISRHKPCSSTTRGCFFGLDQPVTVITVQVDVAIRCSKSWLVKIIGHRRASGAHDEKSVRHVLDRCWPHDSRNPVALKIVADKEVPLGPFVSASCFVNLIYNHRLHTQKCVPLWLTWRSWFR